MNAASSPSSSLRDDVARQEQAKRQRLETAIAHLTALCNRCPAAEELASSWHGVPVGSDSQTTNKKVIGLRDLKRSLDSGKRVASSNGAAGPSRGLPMWLVIRAVKASWHQDGSWPLLGADEDIDAATEASSELEEDVAALSKLPRSIHPTALLLRPAGQSRAHIPPRDPELDRGLPPQRPDPEPEDVARRYEAQGIDVGPRPSVGEGWEDEL